VTTYFELFHYIECYCLLRCDAILSGKSQHIIATAIVKEIISMLNMVVVYSSEMLVPLFHLSQCHIPEHSIFRLTAMRTSNLICICSTKTTWTYLKYKELQNSIHIYFTIKIYDFKIHSFRLHINIWREVTLRLKSMAQRFTCLLKNGSWSGANIVLIYLLHLQLPASLLSSLGPQISENII